MGQCAVLAREEGTKMRGLLIILVGLCIISLAQYSNAIFFASSCSSGSQCRFGVCRTRENFFCQKLNFFKGLFGQTGGNCQWKECAECLNNSDCPIGYNGVYDCRNYSCVYISYDDDDDDYGYDAFGRPRRRRPR